MKRSMMHLVCQKCKKATIIYYTNNNPIDGCRNCGHQVLDIIKFRRA